MLFFPSIGMMKNNKNEIKFLSSHGITSTGISWWRAKPHIRIGNMR